MSTKDAGKDVKHHGVPRTLGHATKLGYKTLEDNDPRITENLMSKMVSFSTVGARQSSICGIAPAPDGSYLVCYKNADGICTWVPMQRDAIEGHPDH